MAKAVQTQTWFVIARGASNQPTTQHRVDGPRDHYTLCGRELTGWTRAWMHDELPVIACLRCKSITQSRKANRRSKS